MKAVKMGTEGSKKLPKFKEKPEKSSKPDKKQRRTYAQMRRAKVEI